jgi:hypothetical protein
VADAAHKAHHANQHVPLLLFVRPVLTLERRFRICGRVKHVVEMACIFEDCATTTSQQNKLALAINACWQNFFYDMCVTPANVVAEQPSWLHRTLNNC